MSIDLVKLSNKEIESFNENAIILADKCEISNEDAKLILTENIEESEIKLCGIYNFVADIDDIKEKYSISDYLVILKQTLDRQSGQKVMDELNKDNDAYNELKKEYEIIWDKMWLVTHVALSCKGIATKKQHPEAFVAEQEVRDRLNLHNDIPLTEEEYIQVRKRRKELNILLGYDENDMDT